MCANNPFNLPLQVSSLTKTVALDQYSTSQFGASCIGLATTSEIPNPKPVSNKICIYNPHIRTHYSSSRDSPALSGTYIDYEGSVLGTLPKKVANKVNVQLQSSLSLDNSLSQVLDICKGDHEKLLKEKIEIRKIKGSRNTPIKICQTQNIPEREDSPTGFKELHSKKKELYTIFTERYELSPKTLKKFFEVAEMENKLLRRIKEKADSVMKVKKKTDPEKENVVCGKCEELHDKLKRFAKKMGIKVVTGNIFETLVEAINEKSENVEREKRRIKKKTKELTEKEKSMLKRETMLNEQIEKFEKRKKEWLEYERQQKEGLKKEEEKLREDWEKLKFLESETIMNQQVTQRRQPKSAQKEVKRNRQISVISVGSNPRRGGCTRKYTEICSARNQDHTNKHYRFVEFE